MISELIDISPIRKELKIEIPAELVQATYDRISREYARQATMPGFRQGRAPVSLVRRRFKEEIASDTIRELVPDAYEAALEEHNLNPLGQPDIHLENADGLKELGVATVSLHAHIEVMPQAELKQYKGLEAVRRVRPVTDEAIEEIIGKMREDEASLFPVEDRPADLGDTLNVSLGGHFINGDEDDEDFALSETDIELGHPDTLPEFTACLLGAQADETRQCVVKYADDFSTESLAGREVEYSLTVNEIYCKELPVLDDEWAQSLEEDYTSLADMQAKIRADEEANALQQSEGQVRAQILYELVKANLFEVPDALVSMQSERLLNNAASEFARMGFDPNRLGKQFWQGLFQSMRPQAEEEVRGGLLLSWVAEQEGLEVTDDDIETEIKVLAESSGLSPEQVGAELLKGEGEETLKAGIRSNKAMDFLMAHARITDGEWIEPTQQLPASLEIGDEAAPETIARVTENEAETVAGDTQSEAAASSEA